MKTLRTLAFLVVAFLAASLAGAQAEKPDQPAGGWKFTSVTVSAGEDALSSGITGSVWLDNKEKKTTFNFVVQNEQGWFMYGRRFRFGKATGLIVGSIGHFKGEPWIGPYLEMSIPLGTIAGQSITASTAQWPVLNAWEPDKWLMKNDGKKENTPPYTGLFTSYQVNIGNFGFACSFLKCLDDPWNRLPRLSYAQKVRHDFSVSASVTRNTNAKKWMCYVDSTWYPGAK